MMKKTPLLLAFLMLIFTTNAQELPEFVTVEGGTFNMGNTHNDENGNTDEEPVHSVSLSTFKMSKTEVTVAQYRKFCTSIGFSMPEEPEWGWNDNDPIVNVNYQDALFYCEWLTEELGKKVTLPTEAQWEYAARGGAKSNNYKFAGSNSILFVGWFSGSSGGKPHPVATKKPNELGLYDMSGNVWEWCFDWYDKNYYANSPSNNPKNTSQGNSKYRVLRGGSCFSKATYCRVAYRSSYTPTKRDYNFGFRVVSF